MESMLSTPSLALAAVTIVFVLGYEWLIYRSLYRKGLPEELLQQIATLYGSLRLPEPTAPDAEAAN
jgi:hypothetical protein